MLGRHMHTHTHTQKTQTKVYQTACMKLACHRRTTFEWQRWITHRLPVPSHGRHWWETTWQRLRHQGRGHLLNTKIADKSNSYCTCSARQQMKTTKFVTGSLWQGPKKANFFICDFSFFRAVLFILKALRVFAAASRSLRGYSLSWTASDRPSKLNQWTGDFLLGWRGERERSKNHNQAATPVFCRGRVTSYLVLFWYLSPRNSSTHSDPSVWGGSFTDEVRPLTAMKQYLKQIKRHFPQLDSCSFSFLFLFLWLTQVLRRTTEGRQEGEKKQRLAFVFGGTKKQKSAVSILLFPQISSLHWQMV